MNKSEFSNLFETMKISIRFAGRHYLSFFLATLGILVLTAVIFFAIVFVVSLPFALSSGPFDDFFEIFEIMFDDKEGLEIVGVILFFGATILAPFLIALGALFGMGQEITESGGTTAEGVLIWYKQKFVKLAAGGIAQFCIIVIPIGLEYLLAYQYYYPTDPTPTELAFLVGIAYGWIVLSSGMLSMVFPALIDGLTVPSALKRAFSMSRRYFDTVFSTWIIFVAIGSLLLGPFLLQEVFDVMLIAEPFFELFLVLAALVLAFVITPVAVLATSRTYLLLSAHYDDYPEDIEEISEEADL